MKKLTIILCLLLPPALFAQSLERQVVSSGGALNDITGYTFSSSTGEAAIETLESTSGTIILTQGFQQPSDMDVDTTDGINEVELGLYMSAYPNPTQGEIILDFDAEKPINIQIGLFDMQGKLINLPVANLAVYGTMKHIVDLSNLPSGDYLIRLADTQGTMNKAIKVLKVD